MSAGPAGSKKRPLAQIQAVYSTGARGSVILRLQEIEDDDEDEWKTTTGR